MITVPSTLRIHLAGLVLVGVALLGANDRVSAGPEAGVRSAVALETGVPIRDEIRGTVVDTAGAGLGAATVQLRHGDRVLASATTDDDGTFRIFISQRIREAFDAGGVRIRVERLGYREQEVPLDTAQATVELVLVPAPLPLPGFEIEAVRSQCEDDEAGLGRRLWQRAAARHPGGLDTLGVATYTLSRTDTLPDGALGTTQVNGQEPEMGQRGSAPILRLGWARRIDRDGYAFPVRRTDRMGSFASWSYPPLESDFAPHFGSRQFGSLHYFQHLSQGSDGWYVRFCARDDRRPHLEGQMLITPDTLIRRIEWAIQTPEPDEDAGGVAVFPSAAADGTPPPLLPAESMAWKTPRGEHTVRRAHWFEEWTTAPGDSVPFLPRRSGESTPGSNPDPGSR